MANYGFYPSTENDRRLYSADDFSRIFDGLIRDGVYAGYGGNFVVSADGSGMMVTVASGRAWFNHTWTYYDAPQELGIDRANNLLDRWDSVVLEVDTTRRENSIKVLTGTEASSPVPPTLANGENGVYQHRLANIRVNHGVTKITNANVYITVGVDDETEFVTVITDINTPIATLMKQYTEQFEEWFENLNVQLDANVAANLQSQINDINTSIGNVNIVPGSVVNIPRVNTAARIANTHNKFVFSVPAGGTIASTVENVSITADVMTLYDSGSVEQMSWELDEGPIGFLTFVPYFEGNMVEFVFDFPVEMYSFPKGLGWIYLENLTMTFS